MNFALDSVFDFAAFSPDTIDLLPAQIQDALQHSQTLVDETQQWQAYLNILALHAVRQWVSDRAPEMNIKTQTTHAEIATQLHIQGFKLNIMAMGSLTEAAIAIPANWIESPTLAAHLYIVVEVLEELEIARIYCLIRRDRLVAQFSKTKLNNSYFLPLNACDREANTLLLYLRCLDPATIPLPQAQAQVAATQRILNVGAWLQNRLDDVATELAWTLLPIFDPDSYRLSPVPALRSPVQELDTMLNEIQQQGSEITSQAHAAFRDINVGTTPLRLYVVTWADFPADATPEWQLILILGTPSGLSLPDSTCLRVSDDSNLLLEQAMLPNSDEPYLYAHIAGELHETFTIELALADGTSLTLPPFGFDPQ
jgi:hypothetical protein